MKKESENGDNDNDQKIYMARMSGNKKKSRRHFGDSSQLANWVLDSGAMCHITQQVSDFIPGLLEDTYKYIDVAGGHHVTANQKRQFQIKMCGDNWDTFIPTFQNVLLSQDLRNGLFSIITLMNLGQTCFFHKEFCMVYFGDKEKNAVYHHILHSGKMYFWGNKANVNIKENRT